MKNLNAIFLVSILSIQAQAASLSEWVRDFKTQPISKISEPLSIYSGTCLNKTDGANYTRSFLFMDRTGNKIIEAGFIVRGYGFNSYSAEQIAMKLDQSGVGQFYVNANFSNMTVEAVNANTFEQESILSIRGSENGLMAALKYIGAESKMLNLRASESGMTLVHPGEIYAVCHYTQRVYPKN